MHRVPQRVERVSSLFGHTEEDAVWNRMGFSRYTGRHHADQAGVPFRKIGGRRFYRDIDIQTWLDTGHGPTRRLSRKMKTGPMSAATADTNRRGTDSSEVTMRGSRSGIHGPY